MTNSTNLLTPNGTYIIMNVATQTYLNVLSYGGPGTAVVCSVGNHLGNDMWNVMNTERRALTLQNYGTGDFASVVNNSAVTSATINSWNLVSVGTNPYAFRIQDAASGNCLRVESNLNGAPVTLEAPRDGNQNQLWLFVGKAPM